MILESEGPAVWILSSWVLPRGGGVVSSWLHLETVSLGRDFSTLLGRIWLLSGEHAILEANRNVGQEN